MAGKVKLPKIDQRAAYRHSFYWFSLPNPEYPDRRTPIDLSGYQARLQVRKREGDTNPENILADWSTENGLITIKENEVCVVVPASLTSTYKFQDAKYDLIVWPDGDIDSTLRLVQGEVSVALAVTVEE